MSLPEALAALDRLLADGQLSMASYEQRRAALLAQPVAGFPGGGSAPAGAPVDVRLMGTYQLYEKVGSGGMGSVWRARHRHAAMAERQGGDVAIKEMHAELANRPEAVAWVREEASTLFQLDHPNVVRVLDFIDDGQRLGLVMEWIPGRALSEMIARETGPMPWGRAQSLVAPLLDALEHCHARGVLHRDVKPDNVRVTPQGEVKLVDFGIARADGARHRASAGVKVGSLDYMAPEQLEDANAIDARADLYAVGMTMYEMLAGRLPWPETASDEAVMQAKASGGLPAPTVYYQHIPAWVQAAVMQCLSAQPADRFADVAALRAALWRGAGHRSQSPASSVVPAEALVAEGRSRSETAPLDRVGRDGGGSRAAWTAPMPLAASGLLVLATVQGLVALEMQGNQGLFVTTPLMRCAAVLFAAAWRVSPGGALLPQHGVAIALCALATVIDIETSSIYAYWTYLGASVPSWVALSYVFRNLLFVPIVFAAMSAQAPGAAKVWVLLSMGLTLVEAWGIWTYRSTELVALTAQLGLAAAVARIVPLGGPSRSDRNVGR